MSTTLIAPAETLDELVDRLGNIPLERIRLQPAFGTATEQDLIRLNARKQGIYELVDGVLVEKAAGYYESRLAIVLGFFLETWVHDHDLGYVVGPDAMTRFAAGLVRGPDLAVVLWQDLPEHEVPRDPIASVIPALAVEIISRGNTRKEIERKIGEYFAAGVRLVWIMDPKRHTVRIYTNSNDFSTLTEEDVLDGGDVLPGLELPIRAWFERAG